MQKATPVPPPATDEEFVDVDMTKMYYAVSALGIATAGLTASTVWLWRKVRRTEQHVEALAEFTSKMVNDTECGKAAYATLMDGAVLEDEEEPVDWSDEEVPSQAVLEDEQRRIRVDKEG